MRYMTHADDELVSKEEFFGIIANMDYRREGWSGYIVYKNNRSGDTIGYLAEKENKFYIDSYYAKLHLKKKAIVIDTEDIKIDLFTNTSPRFGMQVTHMPTGIVLQRDNGDSDSRKRVRAMLIDELTEKVALLDDKNSSVLDDDDIVKPVINKEVDCTHLVLSVPSLAEDNVIPMLNPSLDEVKDKVRSNDKLKFVYPFYDIPISDIPNFSDIDTTWGMYVIRPLYIGGIEFQEDSVEEFIATICRNLVKDVSSPWTAPAGYEAGKLGKEVGINVRSPGPVYIATKTAGRVVKGFLATKDEGRLPFPDPDCPYMTEEEMLVMEIVR